MPVGLNCIQLNDHACRVYSTSIAILSLAHDTFEGSEDSYTFIGTYTSLYMAVLLAITATASAGFDAARMHNRITEDDFHKGYYSHAHRAFRMNPILLFAATIALSFGLGTLVSGTQPFTVRIVFFAISLVLALLFFFSYIASYLSWCYRVAKWPSVAK